MPEFFPIAVSAGATFPLYAGVLYVLSRNVHQPFIKAIWLFLLGMLSTLPFILLQHLNINQGSFSLFFGPLASILLLAFLEEFFKSLFLFLKKDFQLRYLYPIIIGIGFAFLENVSYLSRLEISGTAFWVVVLIRLFMDSTAHAVFTSSIVYFLKRARYKSKTLYYLLGLFVSGSLHALFNLLHHLEMNYLVVPLLMALIYWLHADTSSDHGISETSPKRMYRHAPLRERHVLPHPHT